MKNRKHWLLSKQAGSETKADGSSKLSFEQAYSHHVNRVFTWALRHGGGDRVRAEDLTQDVFTRLFVQFDLIEQNEHLVRWLHRVTMNLAISDFRREGHLWDRVKALLVHEDRRVESPAELFERRETVLRCEQAIQGLPLQQRESLWMKLVDGRSQRDISREFALSEGRVSKIISQGLATLRKLAFGPSDDR